MCCGSRLFSLQMNSIISLSTMMCWFSLTVHGLVYAFGSSTVTSITVEDPKAYTKPWTVTVKQRIMLDTELIEFICWENEKDTRHFDK